MKLQRLQRRYPLDLPVQFKQGMNIGTGRTVNISSGGMLIQTRDLVAVDEVINLEIDWPALLDGKVGLRFITGARVLRLMDSGFAVSYRGPYHFRTRARTLIKVQSVATYKDIVNARL